MRMTKIISISTLIFLTGCAAKVPDKNELAPFEIGEINFGQATASQGGIYGYGGNQLLIGVGRRYQVGDLVIVNMQESIKAKDSTATKTKSNVSSSTSGSANFSLYGGQSMNGGLDYESDKKADGSGSTDQSHSLAGSIACTVTKVYPNGVLEIKGTKQLTLEKGTETIALVGHIKEQDISTTTNTINSDRIANSKIYYRGDGYIYDKSTEGWLSGIITSKYWPF